MTVLLKTCYPQPRFPPLSLSGVTCRLLCRHCNAAYLGGMLPAETPEALVAVCRTLREKNAVGVLLSGGSDRDGSLLNLKPLLGAIALVRRETGLIVNIHPGLVDDVTARRLAVDFASLEIPRDDVVADVFGLPFKTADYLAAYRRLRGAGARVVPHISVYTGGEDALLDALEAPEVVVVIVFSPTPGTQMARARPPAPETVAGVIARIKARFPEAEIALGCSGWSCPPARPSRSPGRRATRLRRSTPAAPCRESTSRWRGRGEQMSCQCSLEASAK